MPNPISVKMTTVMVIVSGSQVAATAAKAQRGDREKAILWTDYRETIYQLLKAGF